MICAYDRFYLEKAKVALGRMLDYAVYDLEYTVSDFFDLFIQSGMAAAFERGEFSVVVGMSGVELARRVLETTTGATVFQKPRYSTIRSPEYWAGWALAHYQWETSLSFSEIAATIPMDDIVQMYMPYHEMDLRHFSDEMNRRWLAVHTDTNLKVWRKKSGLTQRELANLSNVPLRTIQQYEQRQKNINKASIETLVNLSRVLSCRVEDLMELVPMAEGV